MFETIFFIIACYFFIVFVFARFFIPHLGFGYDRLPERIPEDMQNKINELKDKADSSHEFLKLTYDYLGDRYYSERFNTLFKFWYLFKNLDKVWSMPGFIPCNQSNFLLRIFLVKSGFFKEDDIKKRHVFVNFVPHQYLKVKVNNSWIDVDVGERKKGMPVGKHLKFFG